MEKVLTEQELKDLAERMQAVFEDVGVVKLQDGQTGDGDDWYDDGLQVDYELRSGRVSCVLQRCIEAGGARYRVRMNAPLAGNTLPEDRMSERERELMREDMHIDFLTGVYNRRFIETVFCDRLAEAAREGRQVAVALVSLDGAEQLRREYGQPALDQIICTMANQWKKHYDGADRRIICRLTGSIFLIACDGVSEAELEAEVRRLYEEMPGECIAGSSFVPAELRTWSTLYRLCDERMRAASAAGGDRICAATEPSAPCGRLSEAE